MATKDNLVADLNFVTEKISSQVWTLNLGTLGTSWSLLIAGSSLPQHFTTRNAIWVFVPCLVSLLCEMGQYLSAYALDRKLLNEMETDNRTEFMFQKKHPLYKARKLFFYAKIILTIAAAVILVYTLVNKFFA